MERTKNMAVLRGETPWRNMALAGTCLGRIHENAPSLLQPFVISLLRKSSMAVLGKIEFVKLPKSRMVGKWVINGGGENPVPQLWGRCFQEKTFDALSHEDSITDYYIGWMGDFDKETGLFTYIAGLLMPEATEVPEVFDFRD
ncbi:hypothetical protein ACFLXI_08380, partial [Chloroflexota bacterium]